MDKWTKTDHFTGIHKMATRENNGPLNTTGVPRQQRLFRKGSPPFATVHPFIDSPGKNGKSNIVSLNITKKKS